MRRCWLSFVFVSIALAAHAQEPADPAVKLDPFGDPITDGASDGAPNAAAERSIIERLRNATDDADAALVAIAEIQGEVTELEQRALRNLDRELGKSDDAKHRQLSTQSVQLMAMSADPTSLQYLHKVFDSTPSRRALIADAFARLAVKKQRRPHDWPLLVRSLTVVEGKDARRVLQALLLFRERGRGPTIQRNVILVGLRLDEKGKLDAADLLTYWTGEKTPENLTPTEQIKHWQAWYHEHHPELPPATLPVDDPKSPYQSKDLAHWLRSTEGHAGDAMKGAAVFEKALCIKCHQFGDRGERIGPDLSKVAKRLSETEFVESMLFPNQQISDQYATKRIALKDGRELLGIVGEMGDSLAVLPATGVKTIVAKRDIEKLEDSALSAMPTGLLDKFTRQDIADLLAYFREIPGE